MRSFLSIKSIDKEITNTNNNVNNHNKDEKKSVSKGLFIENFKFD